MRRLAVMAALVLAACGGDDQTERLEAAACTDLRSGMDLQAVANSGVRNGLSRQRVAAILVTAVNSECPEYQDALDESLVPGWLD